MPIQPHSKPKIWGKSVKNLTISYRCKIYRFDKSTCENSNLSVKVKFPEVKFGLSEKQTKFEKIFLMVLTNPRSDLKNPNHFNFSSFFGDFF